MDITDRALKKFPIELIKKSKDKRTIDNFDAVSCIKQLHKVADEVRRLQEVLRTLFGVDG
jgi:hypothetical protein